MLADVQTSPLSVGPGAALGAAIGVIVVLVLSAVDPLLGLAALGGGAVFVAVVAEPVRAAYLYLAITPMIAGLQRGSMLPLIRPSEALLAVVASAVALRFVFDALDGHLAHGLSLYRITNLDRSLLAMAIFSSVVPLLWRVARSFRPLQDDFLFATVMWKYLLVFVMIRLVVVSGHQLRNCVAIILASGFVVGLIAIAQAVDVPGVSEVLAFAHQEEVEDLRNNRGSSTLGTSHGVADVMSFNLGMFLVVWWLKIVSRPVALAGICFFGMACLASGQFSGLLALLVAVVAFGMLTGKTWRALALAVPSVLVAGVLLWPVIQARVEATDASGVPQSWQARHFNLTTYFWPELFSSGNWLLGVRPSGRLPSFEPWREWVFIESGHTWLLWTGGVPLLLAYGWFTWSAYRASLGLGTVETEEKVAAGQVGSDGPWRGQLAVLRNQGMFKALGLSTAIAFTIMFALMTFDVHLTMRGVADVLFPLLALVASPVAWADRQRYEERVVGSPLVPWQRLVR